MTDTSGDFIVIELRNIVREMQIMNSKLDELEEIHHRLIEIHQAVLQ
jgi:hypothetical protein